ncbi:MAG: ABC transporter permease [Bacillota bacterium]|nr:ABC transporter permease [Bacillota bacterium]
MTRRGTASPLVEGQDPQPVSLLLDALRRFLKNRAATAGGIVVILVWIIALSAPLVAPYDPIAHLGSANRLKPPGSPGYLLGTDDFGRDLLSRLIYGARISLQVGIIVVLLSGSIGVTLGAIAGYFGGLTDEIIMRSVDIVMAFPFFILAIAIMAVLGPSLNNAMIALAMVSWVGYARLVRGQVLSVKQKEFIEAARAEGLSDALIILRHVLPNCMAPILIQATLGVGGAILSAAGLSFIGLGAQPPDPEWGAMLNEGREYLRQAPYLTIIPGTAIAVTVLALNLLGDGLRDALDPRLR